ncbi:kinesin-like protein KIN-6 isoform X2 [Andrographis paniculata]|uniref:kinesin-like protein KIN-6 isoform X2 n=1 Tax=Andrographis paniculata TaxID=175694 RepID=UPI0021E7CEEF|nr:kinesin-like protein KIN-6 isoform X2 [Andrographis paniculata]
MEMNSPTPCPPTVTVRRNPPRRARATPASAVPLRGPLVSPSLSRDLFSSELSQNPDSSDTTSTDPSPRVLSESLKVYLRIRPPTIQKPSKTTAETKNAWPKNAKIKAGSRTKAKKSDEICVQVNDDSCSVTVSTPQALQETKRTKSEVYGGFSRVFASEASQSDVYNEMVRPLVEDFLKGKGGMLAAMGPSGSGKTHTIFGCARDPGMVPLVLRHIFSEHENAQTQSSRVFYLSMFEISLERGKAERMTDLLHEGADIYMQNTVLKGLQEDMVCDALQAESLIASGMLRRATAVTNSNCQSSRSQCIINIRCSFEDGDEAISKEGKHAVLTIADLAGAEREKKTGNQGARLQESNFINNTSMVFGLCLRALLEHQKNRSKLLQKHYKSSMLTRYMQDYMEGKKRMMLILTVKPGVDDYLDTSFLLRQASPFTKIKFQTVQEAVNTTCHKRPNQVLPRVEKLKKMKYRTTEASSIDEGKADCDFHCNTKIPEKVIKDGLKKNISGSDVENLNETSTQSDGFIGLGKQEKPCTDGNCCKHTTYSDREYKIMLELSKALWNVLKQYKRKLEAVEIENGHLRDSLSTEKTRNLNLEKELNSEKMMGCALQDKLEELKSQCRCSVEASSKNVLPLTVQDASSILIQCDAAGLQEGSLEGSSCSSKEPEQTQSEKTSYLLDHFTDVSETFVSCSEESEKPCHQLLEDLSESNTNPQAVKNSNCICAVDSKNQELSAGTDYGEALHSFEDTGGACTSSRIQETIQLPNTRPHSSHEYERDHVNIADGPESLETKNESVAHGFCSDISLEFDNVVPETEETKLTPAADLYARNKKPSMDGADVSSESCLNVSLECVSRDSSEDDAEILKDSRTRPTQLEDIATEIADHIATSSSSESSGNEDILFNMDGEKQNYKEDKEYVEPVVAVISSKRENSRTMSENLPKVTNCSSAQHTHRPKRRLLPASSLLLKDISMLNINDNEKPKGARRVPADDNKIRTQGSISLLNILTGVISEPSNWVFAVCIFQFFSLCT